MENILEQVVDSAATLNLRAKMTYLRDEKERLELALAESQLNNQLLRRINAQLASSQPISHLLNQQNAALEQAYARLLQQNQALSSRVLLGQQLLDEQQQESVSILRTYEEKIIELRRSIQLKESYIQNLQGRLSTHEDKVLAPPTNVTLLFFNEIEELKQQIAALTVRCREADKEVREAKTGQHAVQTRLNLLEALAKSSLTFKDLQMYYGQKRTLSAPKKDTYIPLHSPSPAKHLNEAQTRETREFSECMPSVKDSSLRMLVYKGVVECESLKTSLLHTSDRFKAEQKLRNSLASNYQKELAKHQESIRELQYFRKATQDLLKVIGCRREFALARSLEKSRVERVVQQIRAPGEVDINSDRKKYWLQVQGGVKVDRPKMLRIKRQYAAVRRSLSCVVDYRQMQNEQGDGVERYLRKANAGQRVSKRELREMREMKEELDFSQFMSAPFDEDLSIISPARKSYSDWKRTTKVQKRPSAVNLTVIEENIL